MGIASALPAVSQAKPHRTAKPHTSRTHRHGQRKHHASGVKRTSTTVASSAAEQLSFAAKPPVAGGGAPTTRVVTSSARRVGAGPLGGGQVQIPPSNVVMALEAGSAGIPGYDDAKCQGLANDYNKSVDELDQGLLTGDEHRANLYGELATRIHAQMSDNCLVVD